MSSQPETPVDLVLSLLITFTAFPLGIIAALAHVLITLVSSIPTFIGLSLDALFSPAQYLSPALAMRSILSVRSD
ncbi:hypothetical protein RHS01_01223 [Rhizoctonia solani]|uniref:Uncharacterized protein n=1 Tax=Rhizoctonia solani TaxID=456999 RepID=A0A8H7M932_9AGAM|nr:hypothetical protein RHS01_01223 [Rhizoctonia solani]